MDPPQLCYTLHLYIYTLISQLCLEVQIKTCQECKDLKHRLIVTWGRLLTLYNQKNSLGEYNIARSFLAMWTFDPRMLQEEQEDKKEKCRKKKTTGKKGKRNKVGKKGVGWSVSWKSQDGMTA